jgi:hypothetical protein
MRRAFVRGVGAKSHQQLQQTAVKCGIYVREERIEIEPTHNGGTRGDTKGFMPIMESLVTVARDASPEEVGAALIQGFDLCTSVFAGS